MALCEVCSQRCMSVRSASGDEVDFLWLARGHLLVDGETLEAIHVREGEEFNGRRWMISGGAGGNCAAHQGSSPCDAAAKLCAFLMVRRNWSRQQISQTLGVPPLVVEECIRNGVSSEALCGRIARWIAESGDDSLPQTLVRAVTEAASDPSSENDTTECQLDGDPIAALDPVTRAYFAELGSSIGQSFISILNDPRQNKSNFKWGSWFVGLVSNALDGKMYPKRLSTVPINQPSSDELFAQYNQDWDYVPYLQLVSASFNETRKKGSVLTNSIYTGGQCGSTPTASPQEDFPWPEGIPEEFFGASYDPACEVRALEQVAQESENNVGKDETLFLSATTFQEDFKVIEERMKELRQWETAVESCLLQHVQNRSEQFFVVSHEFTDRAGEARAALDDVQQTRRDVNAYSTNLVKEMMTIAQSYRLRNNLAAARDLATGVVETLTKMVAIENWISLPERNGAELPLVVKNYCVLHNLLFEVDDVSPEQNRNSFGHSGLFARVEMLKNVPERMSAAKESLRTMVMKQMEAVLMPHLESEMSEDHALGVCEMVTAMNLWPAVLRQNRERLIELLWSGVRDVFVSAIQSSGLLNDSAVQSLSTTAVTASCSRDEKLSLIGLSDSCRLPAYMQILNGVTAQISDFVGRASQRWALLVVTSGVHCEQSEPADEGEESLWSMIRKHLFALFSAAEGTTALFIEARAQPVCVPSNARDLQLLLTAAQNFMQDMVAQFSRVAETVGGLGDPWSCLCGKSLKAAMTRLGKEHVRSHHARNIEKIRLTVEGEDWGPHDSDADFQSRACAVFRSDNDSVTQLKSLTVFTDFSDANRSAHTAPCSSPEAEAAVQPHGGQPSSSDPSVVGDGDTKKPFLLPNVDGPLDGRVISISLQMLLESLSDYDDYLGRFPFLAFDIMGEVYDLLKLYISQCAALLLGAMAVENGTLAAITVQHMAVASQNLALLYDGIPLIQKRWEKVVDVEKISPSTPADMARVRQDCKTYRFEFFAKMASLVKEKVDEVGVVSGAQWQANGSEWVMTMLRETARLMRTLKPLLPPSDCRGVVVPLLGTFARMIRAVTMSPDVDEGQRETIRSDVLVFKANLEKFGFDVLRCVALYVSPVDAMNELQEPCATDEAVVEWFFGDV